MFLGLSRGTLRLVFSYVIMLSQTCLNVFFSS